MALIKCKECGKEISSEAPNCPHCGNPQKVIQTKSPSVFGIVLKVLISLFVILLIIPMAICGGIYKVGTNTIERFGEARKEETNIQIKNLQSALKLFKLDNGFYPETKQGLNALMQRPSVGQEPCCYAAEGYLEGYQVPLDGWKNEFVYVGPDDTGDGDYEIISVGADGLQNTEDDLSSRSIR